MTSSSKPPPPRSKPSAFPPSPAILTAAADTVLPIGDETAPDLRNRSVVPVFRRRDGAVEGIGTAFCIGVLDSNEALFLTAAHNFPDAILLDMGEVDSSGWSYFTSLPSSEIPRLDLPRPLARICPIVDIDLTRWDLGFDAAGFVVPIPPHTTSPIPLRLSCAEPVIESRTAAIGYDMLTVRSYFPESPPDREAWYRGRFAHQMDRCVGGIEEVYPAGRDPKFVPYPCFRTNALTKKAMSGGPVVNTRGQVIGVLCRGSSVMESEPGDSYCALIANFFGVNFWLGVDKTSYSLAELIESYVIPLVGRCQVETIDDRMTVTWPTRSA